MRRSEMCRATWPPAVETISRYWRSFHFLPHRTRSRARAEGWVSRHSNSLIGASEACGVGRRPSAPNLERPVRDVSKKKDGEKDDSTDYLGERSRDFSFVAGAGESAGTTARDGEADPFLPVHGRPVS